MTLETAVKILNERQHRSYSQWYISSYDDGTQFVCTNDPSDSFYPFEAIAIAEKYISDSQPPKITQSDAAR